MSLLLMGAGRGVDTVASFVQPTGTKVWVETDATHLYTDSGTTLVTTAGQAVQQANDQSGNGNNYNTATSGQRPTYQVVSGLPVLRFDGSDDRMISASGIALQDGSGQSWGAICCKFANLTAASQFLMDAFQSSGSFFGETRLRVTSAGASVATSFDNTGAGTDDSGSTISAGTWYTFLWQVTWNGSSGAVELWVNDVSGGSTAISAARMTGTCRLDIGADSNGVNNASMDSVGWGGGSGVLGSSDRTAIYNRFTALHP